MKKFKIATSFVIGKGHKEKNIPCQDRVYSFSNEEIGIICLADGAGSCQFSDEGAEIATRETIKFLKKEFDSFFQKDELIIKKEILKNIYLSTVNKIKEKNKNIKKDNEFFLEYKKYSSTLLFVAIKENKYLVGHLGDGLIGYLDKNNNVGIESEPKNAEYANTTFFTTGENSYNDMKLYKGEDLGEKIGFVIMSDGISPSILDKKNKKLSSVLNQMFNWLDDNDENVVSEALKNNIENIFKNRTFDDCSIGILKIFDEKKEDLKNDEIKRN